MPPACTANADHPLHGSEHHASLANDDLEYTHNIRNGGVTLLLIDQYCGARRSCSSCGAVGKTGSYVRLMTEMPCVFCTYSRRSYVL